MRRREHACRGAVEHPDPAQLHALADREVSPAEGLRLARHLHDCGPCRDAQARIAALTNQLSRLPAADEPAEFAERILEHVRTMASPRRDLARAVRLVAPLLILAAGALVSMAGRGAGWMLRVDSLLRPETLHPLKLFELLLAVASAALGGLGRAFEGFLPRIPVFPVLHAPGISQLSLQLVGLLCLAVLATMAMAAFAGHGFLRPGIAQDPGPPSGLSRRAVRPGGRGA